MLKVAPGWLCNMSDSSSGRDSGNGFGNGSGDDSGGDRSSDGFIDRENIPLILKQVQINYINIKNNNKIIYMITT